jgi:hypothetical protein
MQPIRPFFILKGGRKHSNGLRLDGSNMVYPPHHFVCCPVGGLAVNQSSLVRVYAFFLHNKKMASCVRFPIREYPFCPALLGQVV